jgi:hypothetical protein
MASRSLVLQNTTAPKSKQTMKQLQASGGWLVLAAGNDDGEQGDGLRTYRRYRNGSIQKRAATR